MIERYTILHEVGRGATGAVYAARDRTTNAVVALKRLDPSMDKSDPGFAERFLKHARSARKLRHRNIVRIHDAGEAGGTVYVAMEMLEGESLRKILDDGPLPIARAIRIAHDIASGLAHAHLQGVAHGALKPSSIMVLRSGGAKITGFGTGQLGQAPGAGAGASYRSPEQLRGGPAGHRSDIFSLGALLYEMLAQRPPFAGDSPQQILENILQGEPSRPSDLNPHVPRAVDAIILRMLAAQPADRMPGIPIARGELQRLMEGLGLESGADADAGADAGVDQAAASVPPASARPRVPTPEPSDFGVGVRPDLLAAEALPRRNQDPDHDEFDYRKAMMERERESQRNRSAASRVETFAAVGVVLVMIGIGFGGFLYFSSGPSKPAIAASRVPDAPAAKEPAAAFGPWQASPPTVPPAPEALPTKSVVTERIPLAQSDAPAAPPAGSGLTVPPSMAAATKKPATAEPMPPKPVAAEPSPKAPPRAAPLPRAAQPAAKVPAPQPAGTAQLVLAVSPGGEIYIDGEHQGTTPPTTTFDLEPGMHRVEVRSGSRKPFLTYMTVEAGDVRRIRHDFNATPSRPPS